MDFGFSEEQKLLRRTAREFLERECSMATVRELMQSESGYDPAIWTKMAELGWLGLLLPEKYGGVDLACVDLVLLLEEMGRALLPSPFFGNLLGTLAVLYAGNETQKEEILMAVAAGDRILTLAITEEAGTENAGDIALRAENESGRFRLTGTKLFVPDGGNADALVVVARTGREGEGGISLLLVDRDAPGIEITPLKSMDQTRRISEVCFEGTPAQLLGTENEGWKTWGRVRDVALLALSADAVGGCGKVLEDSVNHAKERVQFGRPIGVNQAVKHRCADMLIQVESSRSITYYAAWALSEGLEEATLAAAMAKAHTGDAYREASAENIQIHGGVGFTWEYDCHLYFRRAIVGEATFGSPSDHRERVAQMLNL
jgi:alkylation response protein AidB-like acyl-CoA dehydrogenase